MTRLPSPKLQPNPTRDQYETLTEYRFVWGTTTYWIPASFHYDGASVPRVAWMFMTTPSAPRVMAAALVHDWLYLTHHVDRETADTIFLWML
ncbi:MAG: DUF1353 domain-containing protein, partial [Nitrospirota bacterium]